MAEEIKISKSDGDILGKYFWRRFLIVSMVNFLWIAKHIFFIIFAFMSFPRRRESRIKSLVLEITLDSRFRGNDIKRILRLNKIKILNFSFLYLPLEAIE